MAICMKVGRQEDSVGNKLRRLHEPHTGGDPENARFVSGGCNHAPAGIIFEPQELPTTVFENAPAADRHSADHDRQSA